MPETDYLIKHCTVADFEYACPKLWSELKPSLTAAVRHCDHCSRKVYLCKTDADIKLYTSVNYCIAIADVRTRAEKEWDVRVKASENRSGQTKKPDQEVLMMGVMLSRESDRSIVLRLAAKGMRTNEIPDFLRKQNSGTHDDPSGEKL